MSLLKKLFSSYNEQNHALEYDKNLATTLEEKVLAAGLQTYNEISKYIPEDLRVLARFYIQGALLYWCEYYMQQNKWWSVIAIEDVASGKFAKTKPNKELTEGVKEMLMVGYNNTNKALTAIGHNDNSLYAFSIYLSDMLCEDDNSMVEMDIALAVQEFSVLYMQDFKNKQLSRSPVQELLSKYQ